MSFFLLLLLLFSYKYPVYQTIWNCLETIPVTKDTILFSLCILDFFFSENQLTLHMCTHFLGVHSVLLVSSGVHMQILQNFCIGIHMPCWFAASIPPSPTSGIFHNVIPPQPPHCQLSLTYAPTPQQTPVYDVPLPVPMCSHCSTPACE